MNLDACYSKNSDEWSTPGWLFEMLDQEFHFEVDAAAIETNNKCGPENYFINALEEDDWKICGHNTFWLNPPYSKIGAFMKKAYEESLKGAVVVCLIPSRTDTKYWHEYVMKSAEIRFIKGRLKFGDGKGSAPFPSCIIIFSKKEPEAINDYPVIGRTIEQPKTKS